MLILSREEIVTLANRGGRPAKLARLRRTRRLQLLLTPAEHKALNTYAAKQGITASEIVRGCLRRLLESDVQEGRAENGGRK
jgi:hypothetical protein